ncbi:MAG TPA: BPL-N domain-containing protein [Rhizomicrobium sp.]|jgi:glutamine amidotransferase-like uncharacterized protein|nr:BPL-N domain-containing protein [Rhizomicrobium sp.]
MNRFVLALLVAVLGCVCGAIGLGVAQWRRADPPVPAGALPILLFTGDGTSAGDVSATETILKDRHLDFSTADSAQMNEMSEAQIGAYRLLIVPGGNFIDMADGLTPRTASNVRQAVQHGLNYLGICAGAFLAADSRYYTSFGLTPGVTFKFYAAEARGIRKAAVMVSRPAAQPLDQYWEDGPQLSGWGAVVARYPDETPAVAQGALGRGRIVLTGIHAEAPQSWRRDMTFQTSAVTDNAYAATLIEAALHAKALPHF